MATAQDDIEEFKFLLRSVLVAEGGSYTPLRELQNDYKDTIGKDIPYKKFGHSDIVSFLSSIRDTLDVKVVGNDVSVCLKLTNDIKHVGKLVQDQKKTKKKTAKSKPFHRGFSAANRGPFFGQNYRKEGENQNQQAYRPSGKKFQPTVRSSKVSVQFPRRSYSPKRKTELRSEPVPLIKSNQNIKSEISSELNTLKCVIRALLVSENGSVSMKMFLKRYKQEEGKEFPCTKFGYQNAEAFLRSMPDTVSISKTGSATVLHVISVSKAINNISSDSKTKPGSVEYYCQRPPRLPQTFTYENKVAFNKFDTHKSVPKSGRNFTNDWTGELKVEIKNKTVPESSGTETLSDSEWNDNKSESSFVTATPLQVDQPASSASKSENNSSNKLTASQNVRAFYSSSFSKQDVFPVQQHSKMFGKNILCSRIEKSHGMCKPITNSPVKSSEFVSVYNSSPANVSTKNEFLLKSKILNPHGKKSTDYSSSVIEITNGLKKLDCEENGIQSSCSSDSFGSTETPSSVLREKFKNFVDGKTISSTLKEMFDKSKHEHYSGLSNRVGNCDTSSNAVLPKRVEMPTMASVETSLSSCTNKHQISETEEKKLDLSNLNENLSKTRTISESSKNMKTINYPNEESFENFTKNTSVNNYVLEPISFQEPFVKLNGDYVKVFVVNIISPSCIHVQLSDCRAAFYDLCAKMFNYYTNLNAPLSPERIKKSMPCAVWYPLYGQMEICRAIILEVLDYRDVKIEMVDYGISTIVPQKHLLELNMPFLKLPRQGIQIFMDKIKPIFGDTWSVGVKEKLEELCTGSVHCCFKKKVNDTYAAVLCNFDRGPSNSDKLLNIVLADEKFAQVDKYSDNQRFPTGFEEKLPRVTVSNSGIRKVFYPG